MGERCSFWCGCISASLGIYFGVTIFFLFTFYYHNDTAGAFGLTSGIFAAISLHLKLLSSNNRLSGWYSPGNLKAIASLGGVASLTSLGFTIYYIVYASQHNIPMLPVQMSYYLTAVWSAMTCKWATVVTIMSYRYARILQYTQPFLIIQEQE